MQVYKAILRDTGEEVAIKVQRPGVEPVILRDLYIFRKIAAFVNDYARRRLGCNAELIVDEFGEKLLEELDYSQEARNIAVSKVQLWITFPSMEVAHLYHFGHATCYNRY